MNDFENILLTMGERWALSRIHSNSEVPREHIKKSVGSLAQYGLIAPNSIGVNSLGRPQYGNTYYLTETGLRYKIYLRRRRIDKYLTPIVVSGITTTVLYILERLFLPELVDWIRDLL